MKTRYFLVILLALVSLSGQAKKQKQLVILHTNDTHSAIFPINEQLPDTMKAGRGGFLRPVVFRQWRLLPGFSLFHHVQG